MGKDDMKYAIDLPNPHDIDDVLVCVEYFETKKQALRFAKKHFNADSKGRINIISKLPEDN